MLVFAAPGVGSRLSPKSERIHGSVPNQSGERNSDCHCKHRGRQLVTTRYRLRTRVLPLSGMLTLCFLTPRRFDVYAWHSESTDLCQGWGY